MLTYSHDQNSQLGKKYIYIISSVNPHKWLSS